MAPVPPNQYSQPSTSHHPYTIPPSNPLAAFGGHVPKLAGLKLVPSAGGRAGTGLSSDGLLLETAPISYPSGPAVDPRQLLANVARGLESLIDRGTIDARPSRQGVAAPRVGACAACREAKVSPDKEEDTHDRPSLTVGCTSNDRPSAPRGRRARGVCRTTRRVCIRSSPSAVASAHSLRKQPGSAVWQSLRDRSCTERRHGSPVNADRCPDAQKHDLAREPTSRCRARGGAYRVG